MKTKRNPLLILAILLLILTTTLAFIQLETTLANAETAGDDSQTDGDNTEVTNKPVIIYSGNKVYLNSNTITATFKGTGDLEDAVLFYTVVVNESPNDNWYELETAHWYPGDSTTLKDSEFNNANIAFMASTSTSGASTNYSTLTGSYNCSEIVELKNVTIDIDKPSIKTFDFQNKEVALQTNYITEITMNLTDEVSGIKSIDVLGYFNNKYSFSDKQIKDTLAANTDTFPLVMHPINVDSQFGSGLTVSGIRSVSIAVEDYAGNIASAIFTIGIANVSDVVYTSYFNKTAAGYIGSMYKIEKTKFYGEDADDDTVITSRISQLDTAFEPLQAEVTAFTSASKTLKTLDNFQSSDEQTYINLVTDYGTIVYNSVVTYKELDSYQTSASEVIPLYNNLVSYIEKYNDMRFSNAYSKITFDFTLFEDDKDFYFYYTKAVVSVVDKSDYTPLKNHFSATIKYAENYNVQLMLKNDNVSSKLDGISVDYEIIFGNSFDLNNSVIPRIVCINNGIYTKLDYTTDLDNASIKFTKEYTSNDLFHLAEVDTSNTTTLIIVFSILGVIITGAILLAVTLFKKKTAVANSKIDNLKKKVDKQAQIKNIAQKAKEEQDALNRKHDAEIEKNRREAIEKVQAERKKKLEEKGKLIEEEAKKKEADRKAAELKEFERLAMERMKQASEDNDD